LGIGKNILQGKNFLFGKSEANEIPVNNDIIQFNSTSNEWELISGVIGNAVQSSSNVGIGDGLALPRVLDDLPFKSLVDGVEIVITVSATELTFSIGAIAISKITGLQVILDTKIESGSNLGAGRQVFKQVVGTDMEFRTIVAGTGINVTADANEITIENTSTGEVNTASNVGTGVFVFLQKTLQDLEFRSLLANAEILITQNALDLAFSIGAIAQSKITGLVTALASKLETLANVGTGAGLIFRDKIGVTANLKSLLAGTGISITNNADDIEISATAQDVPPSFALNTMNTEIISAGTSTFFAIVGFASDDVDEIDRQVIFPNACIMHRMALEISVNASASGASVLVLRINGVDGNLIITVPALTTGSFQDLSNSDSIANLDLVAYRFNKGADFSITVLATGIEIIKA